MADPRPEATNVLDELWLARLSVLSIGLQTKRPQVQFPDRAHTCIMGQVPGWGLTTG